MSSDSEGKLSRQEAEAGIDQIIAELGPDRARELLELALTELVMGEDPEADD